VAKLPLSIVAFSRVTRGAAMPNLQKSGIGQGHAPPLSAAEVKDVVACLASLM
jgi:hypothetical protein